MEALSETELLKAKSYIYNIDFSNIINKLVNHLGWLKQDALEVCEMYRNFLFLNKKYGNTVSLPPSEDIDEFWHQHILDTYYYQRDCQAIFGIYFEHYPYFGIDGKTNFGDLEKSFEQMLKIYLQEFGEALYTVRGPISKMIAFFKTSFAQKPKKISISENM